MINYMQAFTNKPWMATGLVDNSTIIPTTQHLMLFSNSEGFSHFVSQQPKTCFKKNTFSELSYRINLANVSEIEEIRL